MFLSCVIRMDTKSEHNSQQNVDEKPPLLNDDVDVKLIDDEEINVRCIEADNKETEVDVIDVDVELINDNEIDVKCIEADKKETEVDVVDAKLIKIDNSKGQHKI
ncbi:hypothetical protein RhiirA5_428357 [Rhizophagus irregularis]|uniref:Uncharacterized protein n=1 Tax=Rhizophagus irregularis TaxID=588596 RepID=A0A2I1FHW0_9GLOM|nr:hypothetical protein RhiirA5_428357 [Rhizophagus irregularis]PKC57093.1 hypothetical protein RhiirA1_473030 [Rhizophagus irregularis]PKY33927.1 hypothetical protein RhiirB3_453236 [Rhizophagus irregularis]CAB5201857.1 unnamed protein product [Rhizophagus irregularis]